MHGKDGSGGAARLILMLAVGLVGLAGVCERAVGQVRSIESRFVTVVGGGSDGAALRCGDDVIWYAVAGVRAGEVLEVDGEKDGWYRAGYPVGGKVVVKLNEGRHIPEEGVVELTRRSRLKAYNPQDPVMEECWKAAFPKNQPVAGTKLIYVEDLMDRSGAHAGYVVVAPEGARGYILKSDVRDATAEEIAARGHVDDRLAELAEERQFEQPIRRRAEVPVIGRDGAIEPERITAGAADHTEPALEAAEEVVAEQVDAVVIEPSEELVAMEETIREIKDSMQEESEALAAQEEPAVEDWSLAGSADWITEDVEASGEDLKIEESEALEETVLAFEPEAIEEPEELQSTGVAEYEQVEAFIGERVAEDSREPAYAPEPVERRVPDPVLAARTGRVMTLAELDDAYTRVVSQEGENPEYRVLIEEYQRHASRLVDEPESERTRSYITTRVQLLEIAAELARGDAEIAALAADAASASTEMAAVARRVRESSGFDLVGRLVSSAVYDGERLPMLYRLVSVEGRVGRTVAYLTDEAALGMDGKLGSVVGVRGEGEPGEVGLVRVIRPEEVVVLTGVASAEWSD